MSWSIPFYSDSLHDLEHDMERGYIIELAEEREDGRELVYLEKAAVGKAGGLKVEIYSNEHPPPHFHVKYNGQENSFRIDDGSPLYPNGELKKWFKNIKKWHSKNKKKMIDSWNEMRPAECPVGPITC